MSAKIISAALLGHYRAGAFFTDALTSFENATFVKPASSIAWARVISLPSLTLALSLSESDEMSGVYQIDVNYPLNSGAGAALTKADTIRAWFKRGTSIGGVEIGAVTINQGAPIDGWYRVSISVFYRAFVAI
tara:strand:+ start:30 stop:428 length:399 start_codon:yes stop_codon:yes gene_type:complete